MQQQTSQSKDGMARSMCRQKSLSLNCFSSFLETKNELRPSPISVNGTESDDSRSLTDPQSQEVSSSILVQGKIEDMDSSSSELYNQSNNTDEIGKVASSQDSIPGHNESSPLFVSVGGTESSSSASFKKNLISLFREKTEILTSGAVSAIANHNSTNYENQMPEVEHTSETNMISNNFKSFN